MERIASSFARSWFFLGVDGGLVRLVGLDHAPLLLLCGDLDQDALGDGGVLAAIVQDHLGKPVKGEGHRDRGDGLTHDSGQILLLVAAALPEAFEGLGLLNGGEIRADRVFDPRDLLVVRAVHEDGGDGGQACPPGCGEAPFVGDVVLHPEEDRGDHTLLLDGFGEFVEGRRIEVFPGLVGHECFSCYHNVMEPTKLRAACALYVLKVHELFRMSRKILKK
jgi:hypothetical protein